jgi:integrase/recombinase XerC
MTVTRQPCRQPIDQLRASPLARHVGAFEQHLHERGYAPSTQRKYISCLAHFACWMGEHQLCVEELDEDARAQFLDRHLPHCSCPEPVSRTRADLRAALGHLLAILRSEAVIPEPAPRTTPVDEELRRFEEYMDHVRGLAPQTRRMHLRTVRRLLLEQFGDRPAAISDLGAHAREPSPICGVPKRTLQYAR